MNPVEDLLARTLRDPARELPVPADPVPAIRRRARMQRRNSVLGAAAVVLVVAATLLAPAAVGRLTRPAPTAATGGELLPWTPRGELRDDAGLVRAAERAWRAGPDPRPAGPARTLWAGRIGGTRVVLLQARTAGGPAVAQVTDQDGALRLVAADPLTGPAPVALQLVDPVPLSYRVRLLATPDAWSVQVYDQSRPAAGGLRGERGDDGLVQVDKVDGNGNLAVALDERDHALTSGLLPAAGHLPATRGPITVVRSGWDASLTGRMTDDTVADGALLAGRLGGPIEIAQLSDNNTGGELTGGRAAFGRFYEVHRGGARYLASLVAVQQGVQPAQTFCLRLERFTGRGPDAVVLRCALPQFGGGLLSVLPRSEVRSGQLVLGSFRRTFVWNGSDGGSTERTGPDFPTGAGRLELVDARGRQLPPIELPRYTP